MSVYFYKLGTIAAVSKLEVIELFEGQLTSDVKSIELIPSNRDDFVYLVLQLALNVSNGKLSWNVQILELFYQLCQRYNMNMRSLRNNAILPPSDGAFYSDLKYSQVFKQALDRQIPKTLSNWNLQNYFNFYYEK